MDPLNSPAGVTVVVHPHLRQLHIGQLRLTQGLDGPNFNDSTWKPWSPKPYGTGWKKPPLQLPETFTAKNL